MVTSRRISGRLFRSFQIMRNSRKGRLTSTRRRSLKRPIVRACLSLANTVCGVLCCIIGNVDSESGMPRKDTGGRSTKNTSRQHRRRPPTQHRVPRKVCPQCQCFSNNFYRDIYTDDGLSIFCVDCYKKASYRFSRCLPPVPITEAGREAFNDHRKFQRELI